jgi:AP-3 complex subunit sigma
MIHAVLVINNHGQVRMAKYYEQVPHTEKEKIIKECFHLVSRRSDHVCNFLEGVTFWNSGKAGSSVEDGSKDGETGAAEKKKVEEEQKDDNESASVMTDQSSIRLIYRHYATLYFVFAVDECESELGILDLIQVFVEALDKCFENVCELDLIFHCDKVHYILDEIIMAGMVLETSLREILAGVNGTTKYIADSKSQHAGKGAAVVTKIKTRS